MSICLRLLASTCRAYGGKWDRFVNVKDAVARDVLRRLHDAAGPVDLDFGDLSVIAETEGGALVAGRDSCGAALETQDGATKRVSGEQTLHLELPT